MSNLDFLLDGFDDHEKYARLRELRVLVAVYCGWDHPAKHVLDRVILQGLDSEVGLRAIAGLPALPRRRVLASFGSLNG